MILSWVVGNAFLVSTDLIATFHVLRIAEIKNVIAFLDIVETGVTTDFGEKLVKHPAKVSKHCVTSTFDEPPSKFGKICLSLT